MKYWNTGSLTWRIEVGGAVRIQQLRRALFTTRATASHWPAANASLNIRADQDPYSTKNPWKLLVCYIAWWLEKQCLTWKAMGLNQDEQKFFQSLPDCLFLSSLSISIDVQVSDKVPGPKLLQCDLSTLNRYSDLFWTHRMFNSGFRKKMLELTDKSWRPKLRGSEVQIFSFTKKKKIIITKLSWCLSTFLFVWRDAINKVT